MFVIIRKFDVTYIELIKSVCDILKLDGCKISSGKILKLIETPESNPTALGLTLRKKFWPKLVCVRDKIVCSIRIRLSCLDQNLLDRRYLLWMLYTTISEKSSLRRITIWDFHEMLQIKKIYSVIRYLKTKLSHVKEL